MKLLICSNAHEFAESITTFSKDDIFYDSIFRFEDNEMSVKIEEYEKLKKEDVLVIQSLSNNVNDNIIELLFVIDILKSIEVNSIKLLLTYSCYSRQDRIEKINESFSFKVVAKLLSTQDVSKIYLIDIHATQTMGFFNTPCINLKIHDFIYNMIKEKYKNPVLVSPDIGNIKTVISLSSIMNMDYTVAIKYRPKPNENKILSIIGTDVKDKDCIIIDDIVDSGGTLCNVAERLAKNGANNIVAYITHPVLSQKSIERIKNSHFTKIYVSNTINSKEKIKLIGNKIEIFSISDYILEKIN